MTQSRCARCRAWLTPATANAAGTYCAAPCSAPARPTARAVAARLEARPAPRVVAAPKPAPAPRPAPAPVASPARTVAAPAPGGLEELRALVSRLEAVADRLERARAPRSSGPRTAGTVAAAFAPVERRALDVALLAEVSGVSRTAGDVALVTGRSVGAVRAALEALCETSEENPDALCAREKRGRAVWYRATADGENAIGAAMAFGPDEMDGISDAAVRAAEEAAWSSAT